VRAAPAGSPNVLVILFDDLGFAQLGCYGSAIDTPHVDALAAGGLRYNRFHVTALCSPSRAALLTGRNHHRVGVGFLIDLPIDAPGYDARRPKSAGTLPRALVAAGYSAWATGKWHLTPLGSRSHAGPFEMWPLGWGFERYYGFLRGDTNQWAPELAQDNHYDDPPRSYDEGYHLSEDLADRVIRNIRDQKQATPDKPFFSYLAFGAMHAPHHVARAWVEPYRGRFDDGWEVVRERAFARQRREGIVPPSARLTPRPPWIAAWSSLDADARRLFTAMQETYAGFLTHTDAQIGRVIDFLRSIGELDDTLVLVMSDNGASAEGGTLGTVNEHRFTMRMPESVANSLRWADDWGGPRTYSHYAWGWAWAGNAPFRLWKRYTWLGGTRSPLIVHWPARIADAGAVRPQIAHIVDIMPTVLDACGVDVPAELDGVAQSPLDGASLLPSFTDPGAPSPRQVQYFEMLGSRSILCGEWKATTDHVSTGVADEEALLEGSRDFATDRWSLFRLDEDFSEAVDVAAQHPERVAELAALWQSEAERNGVAPLKDALLGSGRFLAPPYPPNRRMTYHPDASPASDDLMPNLCFGGSVTARIEVPASRAEGVLCQIGDWNSGFALVVIDGRLVGALSMASERSRVVAPEPLAAGAHEVAARLRRDDPEAKGPSMTLVVDGVAVASVACPFGFPLVWQHGGTALSIGRGRGFPVDDAYRNPFPWTGRVRDVVLETAGAAVRLSADTVADALARD
jgi:arylsulfatase